MRVSSWLCGRKGNRRFRTVFIPFRRERESGCRRGPRNWGRGVLSIICPYRRSGTSDEQKRLHLGGAFFVISKHRANQIFHKFTFLTWLQQILILDDSSQCTQQPPHGASFYPFFIHTKKSGYRFHDNRLISFGGTCGGRTCDSLLKSPRVLRVANVYRVRCFV